MKNIAVTGATGFIGRHLVRELLERGYTVTAVARDAEKGKQLDWFDRVNFISCDLHEKIENHFEKFGRPDILCH